MNCPDCTQLLSLPEDPHVGTVLICENCGAEVELTSVDPLAGRLIEEMK